jgi:thimet oligopeptidase
MNSLPFHVLACVPMLIVPVVGAAFPSDVFAQRIPIQRADDLPRHTYPIVTTIAALLADDREYAALATQVEADLMADLAKYDINDVATLKNYFGILSDLALQRGDFADAARWQDSIRVREEKPALRQLAGIVERSLAAASRAEGADFEAAFREGFRREVSALSHGDVQSELRMMRQGVEFIAMPNAAQIGRNAVERLVRDGRLSLEGVQQLARMRAALDRLLPVRETIVAVLDEAMPASTAVAKPDIWSARDVGLDGRTDLTPVVIAIWDSGVDVELFPGRLWLNASEVPDNRTDDDGNGWIDDVHGIAWTIDHEPTTGVLAAAPLSAARMAAYRAQWRGNRDNRTGVDSRDAQTAKQRLASMSPDEHARWLTAMRSYSGYVHGTHNAGTAMRGNPAARLLVARYTWDDYVDRPPSLELAQRWAGEFAETVAYFRRHGVRVVNMSFGFYARELEARLVAHGVGESTEQGVALARRIFRIKADAWRQAMSAAPEILFVGSAGNDDLDTEFIDDAPSAFDLPNLIIVGAVDHAGDEWASTSYGSVDVHAHGVDVESVVPGGEIGPASGTSMATPQVTNLAAKLLALQPELTVAELRRAIVETADEMIVGENRRIRLLNPRAAVELVTARPDAAQRAGQPPSAAVSQAPSEPFYPADLDAAKLARLVDDHLAAARAAIERLVAVTGPRTADNTLRPFDDAYNRGSIATGLATIAVNVHPDSAVRAAGLLAEERVSRLQSELTSDPRIARAFATLDTAGLTAEERLLAARIRRDLRRAGADRDETTRQQLRAHFEALDRLGTAFARNLAEDTTTVRATRQELEGMPPDWIAAHDVDAHGRVILTARYVDFIPINRYAANRSLRRRFAVAFANRGRPANAAVLDSLLRTREAVAHMLNYPDWAAYQAEIRMAGSPDTIRAFLGRVHAALAPARERLSEQYLARLRRDDSTIAALRAWDLPHAGELTRRERYALDGREVRSYFPFVRVKEGLLELAGELFGVRFQRVTVPVWHPDVEAYEVRASGALIGRFYLDLHPRPGKYTHYGVAGVRPGIAGRQLPEAVLMTNFPGGEPGEPGLMEHGGSGVTTFFHEFGHLLHAIFAVRPYAATAWPDEFDFIEAPSQMLEEWAWHPAVLRRITRHVETAAPIPDDLVRRMRQADAFDRPMQAALQATFSAMLLELHDRPAAQVDPDSIAHRAFATFLGVAVDPEMHPATSLDHVAIGAYSATYYTYLWSQVIAKDLWSAFDADNPLDPTPVHRYRDTILRPGGSQPAARLIENFLGRPFAFASWQQWVEAGR